jgi:predicted ATPase
MSPARVPPRVERVRVRNFRALRDIVFDQISPLSVLLGPNGSGKSTVFDVFAFLSECFSDGLRRAVASRGDGSLRDLRSRDSDGPISLELTYREGYQTGQARPFAITYHLEIDEEQGRPVVGREWMRWKRQSHGAPFRFLDYERGLGRVITGEAPEKDDTRVDRKLTGPDVLAVSTLGQLAENPRVKALRDFVTGWHLSHLSAKEMRQIPAAGPQEHLSRSGDNLVNVILYLQQNYPERLEHIFETLRQRVPRIESVSPVPLPSGHLLLMVKDAPFKDAVQARYASDGTMKLLAYLVQLHDPAPPPLTGIEEPENFLHPKLLQQLAEECDQAASATQLIVTTHSPFFIDALRPWQVWAMMRGIDGYAIAKRADHMVDVTPMLQQGASLGQLWTEGYFEFGNP